MRQRASQIERHRVRDKATQGQRGWEERETGREPGKPQEVTGERDEDTGVSEGRGRVEDRGRRRARGRLGDRRRDSETQREGGTASGRGRKIDRDRERC